MRRGGGVDGFAESVEQDAQCQEGLCRLAVGGDLVLIWGTAVEGRLERLGQQKCEGVGTAVSKLGGVFVLC